MKFSVGDVVRYIDPQNLVSEFREQWGTGPFVVIDNKYCGKLVRCHTLEGIPITRFDGQLWGFGVDSLVVDPFLTAARKAIAHETR